MSVKVYKAVYYLIEWLIDCIVYNLVPKLSTTMFFCAQKSGIFIEDSLEIATEQDLPIGRTTSDYE